MFQWQLFFCIHHKQQQIPEKEVATADWKNKQKHKGMAQNGLKSFFEEALNFFHTQIISSLSKEKEVQ